MTLCYPILKDELPEDATGGIMESICYLKSPGTVRKADFTTFLTFRRDDGRMTSSMEEANFALLKAEIRSGISKDITWKIWMKFIIMATFGVVC
jgi:hypothetical protein